MLSFKLNENGEVQRDVSRKKECQLTWKERKRQEIQEDVDKLSPSQKEVFNAIVDEKGGNIFLTGGAGTGKSFVIALAVRWLCQVVDMRVSVTSSTATAARLVNGVTTHSFFRFKPQILLDEDGQPVAHAHRAVVHSDVVVIDEVSMIRCDVFSAIAASIERANRKRAVLGLPPIRLICVGDFCQLPPVIADEERAELEQRCGYKIGNAYAFLAPEWRRFHFRNFELKDVVRQDNTEFIEVLNKIRIGNGNWTNWFNEHCSLREDKNALYLFPYNEQVKQRNRECLDTLNGKEEIFQAELFGEASKENVEDIGLDYELHLKRGCSVMIRCNPWDGADWCEMLDVGECTECFCNGSMAQYYGTVHDKNNRVGLVVVLRESGLRVVIYPKCYPIYRYTMISGKMKKVETGNYFNAYPLSLGYATSVHRSQGATLASVNLNPQSFTSGMLYVGLSRVRGGAENIHLDDFVRPWDAILDPTVKEFYENIQWE